MDANYQTVVSCLERIENRLSTQSEIGLKKVLTLDEVAEYTGLKKSYLYKLTSTMEIPHSKPNGKTIFIEREKLEEWLLKNPVKTKKELSEQAQTYLTVNNR